MRYVVLKSEKSGKLIKLGRFGENGITESYRDGEWKRDRILYSELLDGLLEKITEDEAEKIIEEQIEQSKIAA
jgi:DNA-binding transcriptional ArsR family regulator